MRRVLFIEHIDYETGGHAMRLLSHLPTAEVLHPTTLPDLDDLLGVVVTGGDMSAADVDNHPSVGLTTEYVRSVVDAEIPLFGICLGHQILARALGAEHHAGLVNEVGLVPVDVVEADPWLGGVTGAVDVVQWHTDVVDLPEGATLLARGADVENQAFRYGSAVGTQFHLEADDRVLKLWNTVSRPTLTEDLPDGDYEGLVARIAANEPWSRMVEGGFTAFAEACAARL